MAPRPGYKSIASGRVSKDRQIYLSIVAFGSVLWIVALISLAAPGFGTFLLTFVTLPVFAPVLKGRNLAREGDLDTAFAYEVPVALRALRHGHRGRRPPHPTRRAGSRNPLASLRPRDQ